MKNDKYTIINDYHGDVKLTKNTNKKVNLTDTTYTLENTSKQIESLKVSSSNEKICLTKPTKSTLHLNEDKSNIDSNDDMTFKDILDLIRLSIALFYVALLLITITR